MKVAKIKNNDMEPTEGITQAHGPQTTGHDYSSIKQFSSNTISGSVGRLNIRKTLTAVTNVLGGRVF